MANKSISQLTSATELNGNELLVLEQNSVAKNMTAQLLITFLEAHGGIASTSYTAPVAPSLQGTLTLTFADGTTSSVPIMNGAAGADGTDGTDGSRIFFSSNAPQIDFQTQNIKFRIAYLTPSGVSVNVGDIIFYSTYYYQVTATSSLFATVGNETSLKGETGEDGSNGLNAYVHIKYASEQPTSNADMGDIPDAWMGVNSNNSSVAPGQYTSYKWYNIKGADGGTGATGANGENGTQTYLSSAAPTSSGGYNYFPTTALLSPSGVIGGNPRQGDLVFYHNSYYQAAGVTDPTFGARCGQAYTLVINTASDQQVQDAVDNYLDDHPTVTGTFTNEAKRALIALLEKVAYIDDDGQTLLDALETELFTARVTSISAVFTQGQNVIYTNDSLDTLKQYLVVTATYSDSSTAVVPSTSYTLSGTLAEGTQTITVTYSGKTDTFSVNCTVNGWLYHFNESLLSSGSEDFGLTGQGVYGTGRAGNDKAYYHMIPTPGTATSDTQYGLKATNIATFPDFDGDFTISYWWACQASTGYMHPFYFTKCVNENTPDGRIVSDVVMYGSWTLEATGANSNKTAGIAMQGASDGDIMFRFTSGNLDGCGSIRVVPPSGFDPTAWHHYALTKKGSILRFFVDGSAVFSATLTSATLYKADQLALAANFVQSSTNPSDLNQLTYGGKMQDFYVAEFCKWESAFNASAITY